MSGKSKIPMKDLRNRVNALRRKMALPLAVVRLRPVAEEFCLQWTAALSCGQPAPQSHPLISRVVGQGFRLPTFLLSTTIWTAAAAGTRFQTAMNSSAPF